MSCCNNIKIIFYAHTNHHHRPHCCWSYSLARQHIHSHATYHQGHTQCCGGNHCCYLVVAGIRCAWQFKWPAYIKVNCNCELPLLTHFTGDVKKLCDVRSLVRSLMLHEEINCEKNSDTDNKPMKIFLRNTCSEKCAKISSKNCSDYHH